MSDKFESDYNGQCGNCGEVRCMHFVLRDWDAYDFDECDGWCCPSCRPEAEKHEAEKRNTPRRRKKSNSINGISLTDEYGWQCSTCSGVMPSMCGHAEAAFDALVRERDRLLATIQAAIGVIDNWKVPLLDPDGKDSSEAVMRLLADDLRKVLEDG